MNKEKIISEITFQTFRSGGKGGQNVNKVETAVLAGWLIAASDALTTEQKNILLEKLTDKINKEGFLQVRSQKHRTQLMNKSDAVAKLLLLIEKTLIRKKIRIATRIPKQVKEKRLLDKKRKAELKTGRSQPKYGDF